MRKPTLPDPAPRPLPRSLYADTARPPVAAPPLDGDARADVAIIGGGFTGLSAALHLAESGADVALLEANEPGWGASGRNGGQVNPGLKPDPDQVERDFGPDLGRRMVRLAWAAPQTVFDLIRRHQIICDAHQTGTLRAAYIPRDAASARESALQGVRRGMPVEVLEGSELAARTGTRRYTCAMLDRSGGFVNPLGYARGLAQAAIQAGAHLHGATPAQRVRREGGLWAVETARGTVRAERIIIGTNGYTDGLWPRLRRSIVPLYSAIVATEPLPEPVAAQVMPARSVLYELGAITTYYRVDGGNRLLMGGRSPMRDMTTLPEYDYLVRYALRLFPALRGIRWTHGWNGQIAVTPDHYPHFHEPAENVHIALGYNGRGVAMATVMGSLLAKRVLGAPAAAIDMPITTLRAIPFHALWKSAATARITYGRIRDRLGL